jgi:prepilin-type N-terminal cleavage/methylation domain-containing protein
MMKQISPIVNGVCLRGNTAQPNHSHCEAHAVYVSQRGFTLIELLLATSIGSMVLAAVYLTFSTALDSQRRIERVSVQSQESRFLFERIRSDIKNAVLTDEGITGTSESLRLTSVLGQSGVSTVEYQLRGYKGGSQLIRTSQARSGVAGEQSAVDAGNNAGERPEEVVVFEQLESLSFRYLIDGVWQASIEGNSLPSAVECTLQTDSRNLGFTFNLELNHVSIDA